MAKNFDPRKILRGIANPLLQEFFQQRGELANVPWDELTETDIEPVVQAWQQLPEPRRREVQAVLQDVNELADERGLSVLTEELRWRSPDQLSGFNTLEGRADRAMWVYLYARKAFDEAAIFARADALAGGRYWNRREGLPRQPIVATPELTARISASLSEFYRKSQLRGFYCNVEPYTRANGAEYFFAYLDDYPDRKLVFDQSNTLVARSERYVFENVFVITPAEGALETYARGGRKVLVPLQEAFCRGVYGVDVAMAALRKPPYRLDHLLDPNFQFITDPRDDVAEVRITRIRLEPRNAPMRYIEVKADLKGNRADIFQMLDYYMDIRNVPLERYRVCQIGFRITFVNNGRGRPKTLSFNVGYPDSCDLKSQTDEKRAVGERCLKLWRIVNDGSTGDDLGELRLAGASAIA